MPIATVRQFRKVGVYLALRKKKEERSRKLDILSPVWFPRSRRKYRKERWCERRIFESGDRRKRAERRGYSNNTGAKGLNRGISFLRSTNRILCLTFDSCIHANRMRAAKRMRTCCRSVLSICIRFLYDIWGREAGERNRGTL